MLFPEPVYLLPVRDRGANAAEEGADLEVPDDGTVGDARTACRPHPA
jgi:hypothetical protein